MSAVKIKQVRSANGTNPTQKATLAGARARPDRQALSSGRTRRSCRGSSASSRTWSRSTVADESRSRRAERAFEEIGLHNLQPKPGSRTAAQADRPRRGLGLGKTSGRGHKGARVALGREAQGRLRGRPEPDPHADAKAARPAHEEVDAVRELPHQDPAGQPRRPRGALRRRRRGDPRDAQGEGPGEALRSGQDPRPRRDLEEARRSTPTPSAPPPRRRSRRPAVPATLWSPNAQDYCERLQRRRHPQEARLHGGDAAALPARRLHPGARRRRRRGQGTRRATSPAPTSSASSTSSRAAASRGSRCSRWGSCPTSPPRSSCSC